jgi:hypothetical protein
VDVIYRASDPNGGTLVSPEPLIHNGKSYVFVSVQYKARAIRPRST